MEALASIGVADFQGTQVKTSSEISLISTSVFGGALATPLGLLTPLEKSNRSDVPRHSLSISSVQNASMNGTTHDVRHRLYNLLCLYPI